MEHVDSLRCEHPAFPAEELTESLSRRLRTVDESDDDLATFRGRLRNQWDKLRLAWEDYRYHKGSVLNRSRRLRTLDESDNNLQALTDSLQNHWGKLRIAWEDRLSREGFARLGFELLDAASAGDRHDIVARDIPLRGDIEGVFSNRQFEINVAAKITHSILETLAGSQQAEVINVLEGIAGSKPLAVVYDHVFLANLVLCDIYLRAGRFDEAIDAARKNIKAEGTCATSQYMLYRSLRAKKESGRPVENLDVCIDDLSDRFCSRPFDTLATGPGGTRPGTPPKLYACSCPGIVPYPVSGGQVEKSQVQDIWNGPEIKEIRRSILDGDFTYCSRKICNVIVKGDLPKRSEISDPHLRDIIDNRRTHIDQKPQMITLGHDPSCNIACPSCRRELITTRNSERDVYDRLSENVLQPLIEETAVTIIICTDGDPFHSKSYRKFIHQLDPTRHVNVNLGLITNGLLLTPREWERMANAHPMVSFIGVSIDGARKETYEDLRRPGKWDQITANMEFMSELRRAGKIPHLGLQFVVQTKNFEEMIEFVQLGKHWNVDFIKFIRIFNFTRESSGIESFEENDICDEQHPLFPRFMEILRDPMFNDPCVDLFTIKPFYDLAQHKTANFTQPGVQTAT